MKNWLIKKLGGYTSEELENLRGGFNRTATQYDNAFNHPYMQTLPDRYYLGKSEAFRTAAEYINILLLQ